ncbi:MAG: NAD-dependent epimerase/dehydratase family protein [Spirochaetes bacterium]|nr:NAD-dependent epimerase/dehydratase family protein [Spirochaetota bacterium]
MSYTLITGASGFLGARLAARILESEPQTHLILTDQVDSPRIDPIRSAVQFIQGDLGDPSLSHDLLSSEVDRVFHLASLVSGGAEQNFELGLKVNVYATLNLLEACRFQGRKPIFVFTSSIATFGGKEMPPEVTDWTFQHPQNSYGVAKVIGEQLLNDYTRKGFIDGRGVRFPAVIVRDIPNTALSGYASNMIREPLAGKDYVCPVPEDTRIPLVSIKTAVETLYALGTIDGSLLGDFRTVNGRGISPSAFEIALAVESIGEKVGLIGTITFKPDPSVEPIIATWPKFMRADRAEALGLPGDRDIQSIIEEYLAL